MKINTLAIIAFTALCAHHDAHGMLCISKLRSFAPIYKQVRCFKISIIADKDNIRKGNCKKCEHEYVTKLAFQVLENGKPPIFRIKGDPDFDKDYYALCNPSMCAQPAGFNAT